MSRWSTPEALELAANAGVGAPEEAVRIHVRRVMEEVGVTTVPVPMGPLFRWANVRKVRTQAMLLDGGLQRLPTGEFDILVREDSSPARQLFSTAHELGHVLFYRFAPKAKLLQQESNRSAPAEEERLCDRAGAEFLMPEWFVNNLVSKHTERPTDAIIELMDSCQVSPQAALFRLSPLFPASGLLELWQRVGTTWERTFRRRLGRTPKSLEHFEPEAWFRDLVGRHGASRWDGRTSLYGKLQARQQQRNAQSFIRNVRGRVGTVIVAHLLTPTGEHENVSEMERARVERVRRAYAVASPNIQCERCHGTGQICEDIIAEELPKEDNTNAHEANARRAAHVLEVLASPGVVQARRRLAPPRVCPCCFERSVG